MGRADNWAALVGLKDLERDYAASCWQRGMLIADWFSQKDWIAHWDRCKVVVVT
jgi:hypothetical protein